MSPNRTVALIAPLCALAAGACATWLAEHFPGIDVPRSALNEIFLAGAAAVLAPALQWLYGWQKHEAREADAELAVEKAQAGVADVTVKVDNDTDADADASVDVLDEEDFDDLELGPEDELDGLLADLDADGAPRVGAET